MPGSRSSFLLLVVRHASLGALFRLTPNSDGLHPSSDGLHPSSDDIQSNSNKAHVKHPSLGALLLLFPNSHSVAIQIATSSPMAPNQNCVLYL